MTNQGKVPHGTRRGWLKNGNPAGDPATARRCGARTRRGSPCLGPAVRNRKRCKFHGGLSSGPRTPEGLERSRLAVTKHGRYSAAAKAQQKYVRELLKHCRATLGELRERTTV